MLTTLTLIHSCTYTLAELDFRHGESMQLVGGNNVGKSSIIHALNFLFVINRQRMSFVGDHRADKTTMEYYFPEAEGSFIVFEVSKRGHSYCIIVWRDGEGNPNYARLHHAYERRLFFEKDEAGKLQSLKLTALRKRWVMANLRYEPLRNQREVFKTVYHTGRANNAVVWLHNNGHGRAEEGFSKLYRYLIDTRLIDMPALREILLLADHRQDVELQYGKSNLQDVERLRRMRERGETLRAVQSRFEQFREAFQRLTTNEDRLVGLALHYRHHSTRIRAELETRKATRSADVATTTKKLDQAKTAKTTADQAVGTARAEHGALVREAQQIERALTEIAALPDVTWLRAGIANVREQVVEIEVRLRELKTLDQSVAQLENRLRRQESKVRARRKELVSIKEWLVLRLAKSDEDRRRLYALLGHKVARSNYPVRRPVTRTDGPVRLFDGEFDATELGSEELPAPESIALEIEELETRVKRINTLLVTARNRAAVEAELNEKTVALAAIEVQLQRRRQLPELRKKADQLSESVTEADARRTAAEQLAREHAETGERLRTTLRVLEKAIDKDRMQRGRIYRQLEELEGFGLDMTTQEYEAHPMVDEQLDQLFKNIQQQFQELQVLRVETSKDFQALRTELLSETADEQKFIEETDNEYAGVTAQQQAITSLINNISGRFASPAADLLNEYGKFRNFITKQFNRALSKQRISNIEQLRIELVDNAELVADLEKISHMDLGGRLFPQEATGMKTLRKYIERGRTICFSNLFTLQLKLTVNGKEKTVDLARQIESDGTDRMLRLVIVMQVIRRLAVLDAENRIVVFVDEIATIDGKNRPQLVRFCADNHFYPIFAAPEMVEGFDRYVLINRGTDDSLVVDRNKHNLDAERH